MFLVSPYNSLWFIKRDDLLPNKYNRLNSELLQPGLLLKDYCQLISNGKSRTIQIRTDYDTSVTARIVDNATNISTPITVTEKANYPDAKEPFSTWEFSYTFNINGNYSMFINGVDSEQPEVDFDSEPISVEDSHPNTLFIEYFNISNTEFVDYSTGIRHSLRVAARIPDGDDETDQNIYDDQNKKTKTYAATTFNGEFTTDPIPEYLVRQLTLAKNLKFFYINDIQYTVAEKEAERLGKSTDKQVVLICSEVSVPGVNADDSGNIPEPIPEDMQNIFPINLVSVSGNQQIDITADYMPDLIMYALKTGTSATIKAGTTIGGDDILSPKTITTSNPISSNDRETLKKIANYRNTYKIYYTITGIGATVDINTIVKLY